MHSTILKLRWSSTRLFYQRNYYSAWKTTNVKSSQLFKNKVTFLIRKCNWMFFISTIPESILAKFMTSLAIDLDVNIRYDNMALIYRYLIVACWVERDQPATRPPSLLSAIPWRRFRERRFEDTANAVRCIISGAIVFRAAMKTNLEIGRKKIIKNSFAKKSIRRMTLMLTQQLFSLYLQFPWILFFSWLGEILNKIIIWKIGKIPSLFVVRLTRER